MSGNIASVSNDSGKFENSQAQRIELAAGLMPIAQVESAGGRNKTHPKVTKGLNAGQTAGGSTGLMPITVKETLKKNPKLLVRYGHLLDESHEQITKRLNEDSSLEADIANHHWDRLNRTFKGDEAKMAYAWNNGITAAKKATPEQIQSHPYVKKYFEAKGGGGKPTPPTGGGGKQRLAAKSGGSKHGSLEKIASVGHAGASSQLVGASALIGQAKGILEKIKSPSKFATEAQLVALRDNGWNNPDTGTELQPDEAEEQLKRVKQPSFCKFVNQV